MTTTTTSMSTDRSSRYLQQMCKHFGHKVPTDFTKSDGRIELPFGTCRMTAEGDLLRVTVEGESADIAKLQKVVGDHLVRFAFREKPSLVWRKAA